MVKCKVSIDFRSIYNGKSYHILYFPNFRCLKCRGRYRNRRRLKHQKRATPVETVLSPRMSEDNCEPIYEDITAVDRLAHTSRQSRIFQNLADFHSPEDLPAPVPALYSNMTFSTLSQDTQSLPETVVDGSELAPTNNIIPPYISRYESLVTWLKNMSTGVQE